MLLLRFMFQEPRSFLINLFFASYTFHACSCITPCTFGGSLMSELALMTILLVGLAGLVLVLLVNVCSALCSSILVFQVALFFALVVDTGLPVCLAASINNLDLAMLKVLCFDYVPSHVIITSFGFVLDCGLHRLAFQQLTSDPRG
jgi:hypothetical protein